MNDANLGEMVAETTEQAQLYINGNKAIYDRFAGRKATEMEALAEEIASENDDTFGELFVAELPLVNWRKVARSL